MLILCVLLFISSASILLCWSFRLNRFPVSSSEKYFDSHSISSLFQSNHGGIYSIRNINIAAESKLTLHARARKNKNLNENDEENPSTPKDAPKKAKRVSKRGKHC